MRSRLGVRAAGLFSVIGFVLSISGAAQAEAGATWRVQGKVMPEGLAPRLGPIEIEDKSVAILFMAPGTFSAKFLCTSAELVEGGTLEPEGGIALGRVSFSGCIALFNEEFLPSCQPAAGGKKGGVIESKKATALLVLHELPNETLDPIILIKPDSGTTLLEVEFGEKCMLSGWPLAGQLTLIDAGNEFTSDLKEHLVKAGPLTKLTFFSNPAILEGSALLKLSGEHTGLTWAASPA